MPNGSGLHGVTQRKTLIACMTGAAFGYGTLGIALFGQFVVPLSHKLARSQDEIGLAFSAMAAGSIVGPPLAGALIDRVGARLVVLVSGLSMGAAFVALAGTTRLQMLYVLYSILALAGSGTLVVAYSRPVVAMFDQRRGAALGLMLAAIGGATAVLPPVLATVLRGSGVEAGFILLAVLSMMAVLPSAILLPRVATGHGAAVAGARHGQLLRHACSRVGLTLILIGFLLGMFTGRVWGQAVPMLAAMGVSDTGAAVTMGGVALVLTVTRLAAGYAIDRFFAPRVGVVVLLPVCAAWLLLTVYDAPWTAVGTVLVCGFGIGVEFDLFSYLVSRYFPHEIYGSFFGLLYSSVSTGLAAGPLLSALVQAPKVAIGGIAPMMAGITAAAIILLISLPAFPGLAARDPVP